MRKGLVLLLTILCVLVGCHSEIYDQTEANVADVKERINAARQ